MDIAEPTLGQAIETLVVSLVQIVGLLLAYLLPWTLLILWVVWWLLAANWKRLWSALADGGWAPLVLLTLVSALVWSRLQPTGRDVVGIPIANFWWQLVATGLLVALALFCGWLQGLLHWAPPELNLEPPVHGFEGVHDESLHHHTESPPDGVSHSHHH